MHAPCHAPARCTFGNGYGQPAPQPDATAMGQYRRLAAQTTACNRSAAQAILPERPFHGAKRPERERRTARTGTQNGPFGKWLAYRQLHNGILVMAIFGRTNRTAPPPPALHGAKPAKAKLTIFRRKNARPKPHFAAEAGFYGACLPPAGALLGRGRGFSRDFLLSLQTDGPA